MTQTEPISLTTDPTWRLEVDGFDEQLEPTIEAVLALVNGYGGTRAALEEGSPVSRPATFVAGIFNTPAAPQAPELPDPIPEIVVAPNWSHLRISANGDELRIGAQQLLSQRRVLDMRQGLLLREWRLRDRDGRVTSLRSLRFASLDNRHLLVQTLTITPDNYSGTLTLESLLDGGVTNEHNTRHLAVQGHQAGERGALLLVRTLQSGYELAFCADATLRDERGQLLDATPLEGEHSAGQRWEWQAEQGHSYTLHKIVAVATSREGAGPLERAASMLNLAAQTGVAGLLAAHTAAWDQRWLECDAAIPGVEETQRQVRWALYHLAGAAWSGDERASVGARALTGERYRGHVFWDTETFVWPFFLHTDPATARALLLYRYHTLNGARKKALDLGYRGALFAWESTDTGEETTPPFVKVPGGELLPILTGVEEHHLSADIAYAVEQYRQATGDEGFFLDHGAEMLLEIARFWASRAVADAEGHYHIHKVIGPDEYHESVDDSAYTNVMARWALRRGLAAAQQLQQAHPARWHSLAECLGLSAEELAGWQRIADGLVDGFDPQTGLFEQFQGYHGLREVDLSDHDTGDKTMDIKLGWKELQKTKVLKQADVVMLMFLLWDSFPPEVRAANFRYYEPRTAHDSSLSPSFHALVAARLGDLALAERYLGQAARIDLDFTRKGWAGASGGVHIAALGGIWQALAFGFLGMHPQDKGLRFTPHIPPHWGALRMPIQWRGSRLLVEATPQQLTVTVERGGPIMVALGQGDWQTLSQGDIVQNAI
ncbi:MAG: glycoside hydrolase family 65 protein [Roseiflexaceae bacterium]